MSAGEDSSRLPYTLGPGCLMLCVRVQPGAKRSAIEGIVNGELQIRLSARPVEGAANRALIELLAYTLDVPKGSVELLTGHTSRSKLVRIAVEDSREALRNLQIWSIAGGP